MPAMTHIHNLDGCAPTPLAHYLKALGILRLLAEQVDADARGWWEGDRFRVTSVLSRSELENFFLRIYEPSPLVAPWNKGSGFFTEADPALAQLEAAPGGRFERFRIGIGAGRAILGQIAAADKQVRAIKAEVKIIGMARAKRDALRASPEYKKRLADAERAFKQGKAELIPRARLMWRGVHREWADAAMSLSDDGTPRYPALLGTGGNDGNLDFTNNFMQRLGEIFDLASAEGGALSNGAAWLSGALWGNPICGCQSGAAVGQFLPGTAGGANNANGPDAESILNPFDFVLMLEGSLLFRIHSSRRLDAAGLSQISSPFALGGHATGYASAANGDESARGEQWMPLWGQPMTMPELRHLFSEGRAQIGALPVRQPLDLAKAISTLGAARGISSFQRFGFIQRNGQSNLAVPLGRFQVPDHVVPALACIDDLGPWLTRLRRETRSDHAPASLRLLERRLSDAILQVTQRPSDAGQWQSVLLALAGVEAAMKSGIGFKAQPVPPLRPEWAGAADDQSVEFRLALALALQSPSVRRHWLPLDRKQPGRFATAGTGVQVRIARDSGVVMTGRNGIDDAIVLIERRLVETSQQGNRHLPLQAAPRAFAHPADLAAWLSGSVDADQTMVLARALMALDLELWPQQIIEISRPKTRAKPPDAWMAIRLALLPWSLPDGRDPGADPAIYRRLSGGDAATAFELARRRLRSKGINTSVRVAAVAPEVARRWASAIAFPVTPKTAAAFARCLDPTTVQENLK